MPSMKMIELYKLQYETLINKRNLSEREKNELHLIKIILSQPRPTQRPKPVKISKTTKNIRALKMFFFDIFTNYNNE